AATMIPFAANTANSAHLREVSRKNALKACINARTLLVNQDLSAMEAQAFEARLKQIESALAAIAPQIAIPSQSECVTEPITPVLLQPGAVLTKREIEVLRYVAEGCSTKETAFRLGMSVKTAACHRYRLMDKLEIHDVVKLVRYAIRQGLIEP
ncbi:MAG TPA: LuxR C-terminal-related transcriptional regulator, partial [Candidatus Solibacter sp.]|nr:LuxR C-terminal-related transcriptional regulator [Candidatus Solibacter sp.]